MMRALSMQNFRFTALLSCLLVASIGIVSCAHLAPAKAPASTADWPSYQGGPDRNQYSALDQITRENVSTLEVAWVYRSGDADPDDRSQVQCNPIIVDAVVYATTPGLKAIAIDGETGEEKWRFDPFADGYRLFGMGVNRGVTYWADGEDKRIYYTAASRLYALNAETGQLIPSFGEAGSLSLHDGLGRDVSKLFIASNSPGAIYKDLLIMGMRVSERLPSAPGHIRAYDVRTGEIRWRFNTIPQPGEYGYDTWPADAYGRTGGANSWAGMSVDQARGIVYVPTGSAASDFYGGDRHGANLFANCLLALNAETGERIWHFQAVHHDMWDRDLPAPPNLVTLERNGEKVDVAAQITKSAHIFIFDRDTGEPFFEIEERPTLPSDLKGEEAWPTQPFPVKPPPFSGQSLTVDSVTDIDPATHAEKLDRVKRSRTGQQYIPPSLEGTMIYPGFDGGGEWGGAAVDPNTGILYVNANEMPWLLTMVELGNITGPGAAARIDYGQSCGPCHGVNRQGDPLGIYPSLMDLPQKYPIEEARKIILQGKNLMPSFQHLEGDSLSGLLDFLYGIEAEESSDGEAEEPAADPNRLPYAGTGYFRFADKHGNPAIKQPWGTLNAIDLNKGEILWKVVLGDFPEHRTEDMPPTGAEGYGGPVVTASGLIFIGATRDKMMRAFDTETGALLWETKLPAGGHATPSTYMANGRQYVVIAAGGGKMGTESGDYYVAFALPE
jgi:quinoprotein glucose dehydrogenase